MFDQVLNTLMLYQRNSLGIKQAEAVLRRCSVNKMFLKILQDSHENICAKVSFLIKFFKRHSGAGVFL